MKCKNCGAPLTMTQRFCPNCGAPNEQSRQHISDMDKYQREFNQTRTEVVSNSKWFVKYIAPVVILAISVIVAAVFWNRKADLAGYRMADRAKERYNSSHQEEITDRMNTLLEDKEYYALYAIKVNMDQCMTTELYNSSWRDFYEITDQYSDLRESIMFYYDSALSDSYSYDSYVSKAASCIVDIEDALGEQNTNRKDSADTQEPIANLENAYHTFLSVYCNLTEDDIAGLADKDQTSVLNLLTRRMFNEE